MLCSPSWAASVVELANGADTNSKSTVRADHSIFADALRTTIQDFLATDDATYADLVALSEFVPERR